MIALASQFAGDDDRVKEHAQDEASVTLRPQAGPQTKAAASNADILIYGGAAGGGKSFLLLLDPLRDVQRKGFHAAIFRRTMEQVTNPGGLWDESMKIYPLIGGKPRVNNYDWSWPNGGTIRFEQLQYEHTIYNYQGAQIPYIGFDELTHFTQHQFFYMLSRNRSTSGVKSLLRATCNPDAGSWVAKFIEWWIDQRTGLPIPERDGAKRYIVRKNDEIFWFDTAAEASRHGQFQSVAFIAARLEDNPALCKADPGYRAKLEALPRVERERLLNGNWKASHESVIDGNDLVPYEMRGEQYVIDLHGQTIVIPVPSCRRFATIDTAGTSRDKADEKRGKPCSWSVCSVWDYHAGHDVLMLHHVWRERAGWLDLKAGVMQTLRDYRVTKAYIENAHHGQALAAEMSGVSVDLIGPVIEGMVESHRGAKLERAIASGLLSRIEDHRFFSPNDSRTWVKDWRDEFTAWQGHPDEPVDQIDTASYAAYVARRAVRQWGGTVGKTWSRANGQVGEARFSGVGK